MNTENERPRTFFCVVDTETGETVHQVESDKTGAALDAVEAGLLRVVDTDRFCVERHAAAADKLRYQHDDATGFYRVLDGDDEIATVLESEVAEALIEQIREARVEMLREVSR